MRLPQFGHIAELSLHVGPITGCQLSYTGGDLHILVKRFLAGVDHDGIKSCIETVLNHLGIFSVVEMEPPLHIVLFQDRKSTRLNSSHVAISYAVFCLKKK